MVGAPGPPRPAALIFRNVTPADQPSIWALNDLPNLGSTNDPSTPLPLPPANHPPAAFPDLADIATSFYRRGDAFLLGERDSCLIAMGGYVGLDAATVEIDRVRVHPACRRDGIGAALVSELEHRAGTAGYQVITLNTATNMPEAVAFYDALGYRRTRRESRPEWAWTLQHFEKVLPSFRTGWSRPPWPERVSRAGNGWRRCPDWSSTGVATGI